MRNKFTFLGLLSMIIVSIDSVRNLPATALFGSQIISLYLLGGLLFFIPAGIIAADFTLQIPKEGGIYTWVSTAFGKRIGFFAIWLQWVENVVWFPSIVSFIAASFAYLLGLHTSALYYAITVPALFWLCTFINLMGVKITERYSLIATIFGLILPFGGIVLMAIIWILSHQPIANPEIYSDFRLFENFTNLDFSAMGIIYLSLAGIEITAAHIKNVDNPHIIFPRAILIATVFILSSQILGSFSLFILIPLKDINLIESVINVFKVVLLKFDLVYMMPTVAFLLIVGTFGTLINWIIAPIKSLAVAARDGFLLESFSSLDNGEPPTILLISQGVIVTILSSLFYLLGDVNQSYWLLSIIPAGLYLLMYLIMFASYFYLNIKKNLNYKSQFKGNIMCVMSTIGLVGSAFGLYSVLLPPAMIFKNMSYASYSVIISFGVFIFCLPALISMYFYDYEKIK